MIWTWNELISSKLGLFFLVLSLDMDSTLLSWPHRGQLRSKKRIWIRKRIISFILFIIFYFGRDKYSILRISKEASKDSGHQESFSRSCIRPFYIVHIIWPGERDKVYIIWSMWYESLMFYSKFLQKKSSRSKSDLSE